MRVIDLINKLEQLGYTDNTEISFGFFDSNVEEFYTCEILDINNVDINNKETTNKNILIKLSTPEEYAENEIIKVNNDLYEVCRYITNKHSDERPLTILKKV